jgi:DNA-binding transcriptional regulator LsrR (DeoR family)
MPIHQRRIRLEVSDLAGIPQGGRRHWWPAQTEVILGALHGGYLDALVTKELVALRLLQLGREF